MCYNRLSFRQAKGKVEKLNSSVKNCNSALVCTKAAKLSWSLKSLGRTTKIYFEMKMVAKITCKSNIT